MRIQVRRTFEIDFYPGFLIVEQTLLQVSDLQVPKDTVLHKKGWCLVSNRPSVLVLLLLKKSSNWNERRIVLKTLRRRDSVVTVDGDGNLEHSTVINLA